jgi:diacylglycerol O-acyltransferase
VKAAAKAAKPERLSRADSARWHMGTPENPMVIGALLHFERPLRLAALRDLVRDRLLPHRRFRQHVVEASHPFGAPCWREDVELDLDEHVLQLDPAERPDLAALAELCEERLNHPLPSNRSPWRFELMQLATGGSALLVRVHHAIADGRALVELLQQLADETLAAPVPEPRAAAGPGQALVPARRAPFFKRLAGLFRIVGLSGDPEGLLRHPLNGYKHVAWSTPIPLASIKRLAEAGNHHVADVLLAAVTGALDRYEREHGQVPQPVHALLPVAMPQATDGALGNHYASVFVRLPLDLADPQARVAVIARDMSNVRAGGQSQVVAGLTRLAGSVAPAIEQWAVRRWSRRASLVVSSLAGPTVPLHLAGQLLQSIVIFAPAPASIGLSLTCFGYAGALRLGVWADSAVIERPEDLVTAFEDAIEELGRGGAADVSVRAGGLG